MNYDLSILNKFMLPNPLIMLGAKISRHKITSTKTFSIRVRWFAEAIKDGTYNFGAIQPVPFTSMPHSIVVLFKMFGVIFTEFKVLYSVVCFYFIQMVNSFVLFKFSSKMLFHNMPVLQDTLAINIYTDIAEWANTRLPLPKISPVRRDIIIPVSMKSTTVHLAYTSCRRIKYLRTTLNSTYFSFSHNTIITCGVN